jgi:hypothetical protein
MPLHHSHCRRRQQNKMPTRPCDLYCTITCLRILIFFAFPPVAIAQASDHNNWQLNPSKPRDLRLLCWPVGWSTRSARTANAQVIYQAASRLSSNANNACTQLACRDCGTRPGFREAKSVSVYVKNVNVSCLNPHAGRHFERSSAWPHMRRWCGDSQSISSGLHRNNDDNSCTVRV